MNCLIIRRVALLTIAASVALGASAQTLSLPGLAPIDTEGTPVHERLPQVPPSERYGVSVRLAEVTHDLGAIEKPERMSDWPRQVGVVRAVQRVSSEQAQVFENADGSRLVVFAIRSPGAVAVRLQLNQLGIAPGDEVYVRSASSKGAVAGPYRAEGERLGDDLWTGSVEGDTAVVEYHSRSAGGKFVVAALAHIFEGNETTETPDLLGCHVDASCSSVGPKSAVARVRYVSDGGVYLCTGTMLNNTGGDRTPYFYIARHCIGDAAEASSVETFWLYQSTGCNSGQIRQDWLHYDGGADLLATESSSDSTLLRLRFTVPNTIGFAGWNINTQPAYTSVFGLHHPDGYVPPSAVSHLRRSQGTINASADECAASGMTSGYQITWNSGVIEGGASGSALFISSGGESYVVGTLSCGPAGGTCSEPYALYGKFSTFFPHARQYLEPVSLAAPVAMAATGSNSFSFIANWTAVSGATSYQVDVSTAGDFSSYVAGYQNRNVGNSLSTYVHSVSPYTTNYYYRVRAVSASGGTGPYSNTAAVVHIPVRFETNPPGLQLAVDSTASWAPFTRYWMPGSSHTIASFNQNAGTGSQWAWTAWSDGGAISHTVAPTQATTYTADHVRQHRLTMTAAPAGSVSPGTSWHNEGSTVPISATPADGESFLHWTGSGTGSYTGTSNAATVTMNSPIAQEAKFTGGIDVTVQTDPPGRSFIVDTVTYTAAKTFTWLPGSSHTIGLFSPQSAGTGTRYVWQRWSDGGDPSHVISPTTDGTYTASFSTQHFLSMSGYASPFSAWLNSGEPVAISSTPPAGFAFIRWDGSGPGSYSGPNNPAGVVMNGPITQAALVRRVIKPDFNLNGRSDILWQNRITGQRAIWWMDGSTYLGEFFLPTIPTEWQIATTGDFNNDGHYDLVWQNASAGYRAIWLMNGTSWTGERWLPTVPVEWQIAASGDFNRDGKADLVWQNTVTGHRAIWYMNGTDWVGEAFLPTIPTEWEIAGVADFNNDHWPDLLWQNRRTGQATLWIMVSTTRFYEVWLTKVAPEWRVVGTGNYSEDDQPDILWQHTGTGQRAIWLMNGATYAGERFLPPVSLDWSIVNQ